MTNEDLIKDIIQSNEMLRIQIWIMGGILSAIAIAGWFMLREAWSDMKAILENHGTRIMLLEKSGAVLEERVDGLQ